MIKLFLIDYVNHQHGQIGTTKKQSKSDAFKNMSVCMNQNLINFSNAYMSSYLFILSNSLKFVVREIKQINCAWKFLWLIYNLFALRCFEQLWKYFRKFGIIYIIIYDRNFFPSYQKSCNRSLYNIIRHICLQKED